MMFRLITSIVGMSTLLAIIFSAAPAQQEPRFTRTDYELYLIRFRNWTDFFNHGIDDLLLSFFNITRHFIADHISINPLAFNIMRVAYHSRFYHTFTFINGIFNFSCTESMPTYVDYIIYTTNNSVHTVFIPSRPISCEIHVFEMREICDSASLMVSICGS